jgi:hypothetical protein
MEKTIQVDWAFVRMTQWTRRGIRWRRQRKQIPLTSYSQTQGYQKNPIQDLVLKIKDVYGDWRGGCSSVGDAAPRGSLIAAPPEFETGEPDERAQGMYCTNGKSNEAIQWLRYRSHLAVLCAASLPILSERAPVGQFCRLRRNFGRSKTCSEMYYN